MGSNTRYIPIRAKKLKRFDKVYNPVTQHNEIVTQVVQTEGWTGVWFNDLINGRQRHAVYASTKQFDRAKKYNLGHVERLT